MSEPINKSIPEYHGAGPASRTESVELPPVVETTKKHDVKYIRSTVLMLIMFCAGLGWAYFEGRQGTAKIAQDQRVSSVNNALAAMKVNAVTGDAKKTLHDRIITPLEFHSTQCQVPADKLACNPFEIYLYRLEVKEEATKPKEADKPKVVEEKSPPTKDMTLESVLLGERPSAMITGKTVYVGRKIGGWTVQEIKYNRVILRWKNQTHVLKME